MLFVMGQAIWRGSRAGWAALMGMQLGYMVWWLLAGFGLGTLAKAYPLAFKGLALLGIAYLAWLGIAAIRQSFHVGEEAVVEDRRLSSNAFRDGVLVAIGNPKSLVYMVALLPPFVVTSAPIWPQIIILALVALVIDLVIGGAYIGAGRKLSAFMEAASSRRLIDRAMGVMFIGISIFILYELLGTQQ